MPKDLEACVDEAQKRVQVTEKIQRNLRTLKLAHHTTSDPGVKYPISKTLSKHSIEKMREAEGRLDAFWQEVDLGFQLNCGKTLNGLMLGLATASCFAYLLGIPLYQRRSLEPSIQPPSNPSRRR